MGFDEIYALCKNYTMTSVERMKALYDSIEYVIENDIQGDFVECGVYKGGSSMLVAKYLADNGMVDRKIYMYDTYEGMSKPDAELDVRVKGGASAIHKFEQTATSDDSSMWCYSSIDEVKQNMAMTNFPADNIIYVKGKVEDTIPSVIPSNISILRLDTDWYASTKHELIHLFPLLSKYGILIIDDYGHWAGAKKAVDDYFENKEIELQTIDYTGRLIVNE